jgi:hypothetical protein
MLSNLSFSCEDQNQRAMADQKYPVLSRRKIEGLIAEGKMVFIFERYVINAGAWIPYHPGGEKSMRHVIGRDATDEITVSVWPLTPSLKCTPF